MSTLTKEVFISTIESLQTQVSKDIAASNAISKVFDTDAVYDNSLLVKALIKLLQIHFPKDENGFCEIEHYCFDMNFGKIQGQELITPEDLWDRLDRIECVDAISVAIRPWDLMNKPIGNDIVEQYDGCKFNSKKLLLDEVGQWPTKPPGLRGFFGMTSTHPLIDDKPNPDGV